jgi:cell division septum initiation protein DivIVA
MSYAPVELRHHSLRRSLLGYNRTAVKTMLEDIADSYATVWRERAEFAERVEHLEAELARHRDLEQLLRATPVSAEQAAQTVKEQGRAEADTLVDEARREARDITRRARAEKESLLLEARRIRLLLHAALDAVEEAPSDEEGEEEGDDLPAAGVEAA